MERDSLLSPPESGDNHSSDDQPPEKPLNQDQNQSQDQQLPPTPQSDSRMELYQLAEKFFSALGVLLVAWIVGWFGLSFAWLILGLFLYLLRYKDFQEKEARTTLQRAIAADEKTAITSAMKYLPRWVYFPDMERAEWINKILKQLWPFVDELAKKLMRESIEPSVVSCLPDYLKSFRFEKVDLGSIPCRIGSVKCYDENTSREEIILDMDLVYAGNCDIQVRCKGLKAGIRDLQISGTLRVEMRPLLKDVPIVGGISFYFLNNPAIEFNLTNLADVLDIPGISDILRKAISEQLAAYLVLPNKFAYPLTDAVSTKALKFSAPEGVVRLELIEAKQLKKSDVGMLGMGKSDPYANINIGDQSFKSAVIKNTINPKWSFVCEAIIHHLHGQTISIEVMDEDQGSRDDFLGKTSMALDMVAKVKKVEDWMKLEETNTGSVHLRTTWLSLTDDPTELEHQVEASNKLKKQYAKQKEWDQNSGVPFGSVGSLNIYLDSARNLPFITRTAGEPSAYVIFSVGEKRKQSNVKCENTSPVWEETFNFLVGDPNRENSLKAHVMDSKMNVELGSVTVSLKDLYKAERMEMERPFRIQGKGKESTLLMTIQMRILKEPHLTEPLLINKEPEEDKEEGRKIPSLEEMIFSTVKPIIKTTGGSEDILDKEQTDRSEKPRDANGLRDERRRYEQEKEDEEEDQYEDIKDGPGMMSARRMAKDGREKEEERHLLVLY